MSPYVIPGIRRPRVDFKVIKSVVSEHLNIPFELILKKNRKADIVLARMLICYLSRRYTFLTHKTIADYLSIDHTSVINSVKRIDMFIKIKDERIITAFEGVMKKLREDYRVVER